MKTSSPQFQKQNFTLSQISNTMIEDKNNQSQEYRTEFVFPDPSFT
jgi:hypothetical protein